MAEVVVSGTPILRREAEPTREYRLKGLKNHVHDGRYVVPGDTVELTEAQALAFSDRFEAVEGVTTRLDRAAGVVSQQGNNVTSTEGVKTTTPGQQPAPQPVSPAKEVSGPNVPKQTEVKEKK